MTPDEFVPATYTVHPRKDVAKKFKPTLNFYANKSAPKKQLFFSFFSNYVFSIRSITGGSVQLLRASFHDENGVDARRSNDLKNRVGAQQKL